MGSGKGAWELAKLVASPDPGAAAHMGFAIPCCIRLLDVHVMTAGDSSRKRHDSTNLRRSACSTGDDVHYEFSLQR